jgi:hypothetical protein
MPQAHHDEWASLIDDLETIHGDMVRLVEDSGDLLRDVHREWRVSVATSQSSAASNAWRKFRRKFSGSARRPMSL